MTPDEIRADDQKYALQRFVTDGRPTVKKPHDLRAWLETVEKRCDPAPWRWTSLDLPQLVALLRLALGVVEASRKVIQSRHTQQTGAGEELSCAEIHAYVLFLDELAAALAKWDEAAKKR